MIKRIFKRITKYFVIGLTVLCLVFIWLVVNQALDGGHRKTELALKNSPNFNRAFQEVLLEQADANRTIVLSMFDTSFADMAYNLYASSFAKFNISNYLFVGADHMACQQLNAYHKESGSVSCATRFNDPDGATPSSFGSKEFRRKTSYKMTSILDALNLGLSVLIVDVDIVFIRNPLTVFAQCQICDLQMQRDSGLPYPGNTGFYFIRSTRVTIRLLQESLVVQKKKGLREQQAFNNVLRKMQNMKPDLIDAQYLDTYLFPDGPRFYENNLITYAENVVKCKNCIIVHNNWMRGKEAKVYRFKETGMWHVDWDQRIIEKKVTLVEGYYSNSKGLYLAYENTHDFGPEETLRRETNALKMAFYIGYLLNRIVILPAFHCYGCAYETPADKICSKNNRCFDKKTCQTFLREKSLSATKYYKNNFNFENVTDKPNRCSLNTYFNITQFNSLLAYREHVYLQHRKVPDVIKQGQSPPLLIAPRKLQTDINREVDQNNVFSPSNLTSGPTSSEMRSWFSSYRDWPVLRFHSLYDIISDQTFSSGETSGENKYIFAKIQEAFAAGVYRQNRNKLQL